MPHKGVQETLRFARWLVLLLVLAALVAAYLLYVPFGPAEETFVDIVPGTGTTAIATQLQRAGIIRSRFAFEVFHGFRNGRLRAGEYRFDGVATTPEVYAKIVRGDTYTLTLIIPEGFNIFDIARAVQAAGLGTSDAFLATEKADTSLIAQWSPGAGSLEGYLFPDTYQFSRHAKPEQMVAAMVRRFRQATAQLGLTDNVARTMTLASLIEKEVKQDSERPLVAGVFLNRLRRGMPLETDPAVIYAALLDGRYHGNIYASDLQSGSLYNTYRHTGLPPGPIANPGAAAIRAAMAPAVTSYLYFVSDAAGHTRFSASLAEHAQQVSEYRAATTPFTSAQPMHRAPRVVPSHAPGRKASQLHKRRPSSQRR